MTPVISPWVFYWMPVVDTIKLISILMLVLSILVVVSTLIMSIAELSCEGEETDLYKQLVKFKQQFTVGVVLSLILVVFIPSEKTITRMIVAQNVTHERVEVVTDTVASVYEDIMNLFDKSSDSNG